MLPVVFDFDGTMCLLFQKYDLRHTSVALKERMLEYGVKFLPRHDAFDVFNVISEQIPDIETKRDAFRAADSILTFAENEAVETGIPVGGVEEIFTRIVQCGWCSVGVATNNSARCVQTFLHKVCHSCCVPVVGRVPDAPERMKPDSWSLIEVARQMQVAPKDIVFVGDTWNDFVCAQKVDCAFIGMASMPNKRERLQQFLPADQVVSDYYELWDMLCSLMRNAH